MLHGHPLSFEATGSRTWVRCCPGLLPTRSQSTTWARSWAGMCTRIVLFTDTFIMTVVRDLPSFPSYGYVFPLDINDFGQVVGTAGLYLPDSSYVLRAVVVSDEGLVDLGTLPGHDVSYGGVINDRGYVAGFSADFEGGRTFLWRDGVMIDTGIAAPPLAMNNLDWIVGGIVDVLGSERAFL